MLAERTEVRSLMQVRMSAVPYCGLNREPMGDLFKNLVQNDFFDGRHSERHLGTLNGCSKFKKCGPGLRMGMRGFVDVVCSHKMCKRTGQGLGS